MVDRLDEQDRQALQASPLFRAMPHSVLTPILAASHLKKAAARSLLFRQDAPADDLFVMLDGWIKLTRTLPGGQQAIIGIFTRGEMLAEAVALTGQSYPASGEAVTDVRYLQVPASSTRTVIEHQPQAALAMISATALHLRHLTRQIAELKARKASQRVAEFLFSLTPIRQGPISLRLPFDKVLIAGRLGMQPESLSRAFAQLRSSGVEVHGARVEIPSAERLMSLIAQDEITHDEEEGSGEDGEPENDNHQSAG